MILRRLQAAGDVQEVFTDNGDSPFGPAGGLDHRRHAVSVQALGLREVDHVEDDSLKEKAEETSNIKRFVLICCSHRRNGAALSRD